MIRPAYQRDYLVRQYLDGRPYADILAEMLGQGWTEREVGHHLARVGLKTPSRQIVNPANDVRQEGD